MSSMAKYMPNQRMHWSGRSGSGFIGEVTGGRPVMLVVRRLRKLITICLLTYSGKICYCVSGSVINVRVLAESSVVTIV